MVFICGGEGCDEVNFKVWFGVVGVESGWEEDNIWLVLYGVWIKELDCRLYGGVLVYIGGCIYWVGCGVWVRWIFDCIFVFVIVFVCRSFRLCVWVLFVLICLIFILIEVGIVWIVVLYIKVGVVCDVELVYFDSELFIEFDEVCINMFEVGRLDWFVGVWELYVGYFVDVFGLLLVIGIFWFLLYFIWYFGLEFLLLDDFCFRYKVFRM